MRKYAFFIVSVFTLFAMGCNAKQAQKEQLAASGIIENENSTQEAPPLIIYFSHAGENYSVGVIEVGNTKVIENYIRDYTGADEFEVIAEKSYDMPYKELTELAKKEQERGEKPAFKGELKNLDKYQTIFVGTPIWWGTFPQVMFTFFDKYDLNNKTIIPFATHEGSGMGRIVKDLKKLFPKADVKEGIAIYGHDATSSRERVEKWLKSQGFNKK